MKLYFNPNQQFQINTTNFVVDLITSIFEQANNKIIKSVIDKKPQKVITLDRLFNNNDQLKANIALQMRDAGIEFKVV